MSRYWAAGSGECITHIRVDTTLLTEWLHPGIYTRPAQTQTHSQTTGEKTKTWPFQGHMTVKGGGGGVNPYGQPDRKIFVFYMPSLSLLGRKLIFNQLPFPQPRTIKLKFV